LDEAAPSTPPFPQGAPLDWDTRTDGYVPIGSYGVLGDGRTVALLASDGQVDWWPVPRIGSPPVLSALLDPTAGGYFKLRPVGEFSAWRRYVPGTNVIETVYSTPGGRVRVTDALNVGLAGRLPWSELARRVEGLEGEVEMAWEFMPGDRSRQLEPRLSHRDGAPVVTIGEQLLAVVTNGPVPEPSGTTLGARLSCRTGERYVIAVVATDDEPLFLPRAEDVDRRIDGTVGSWRRWADASTGKGRWGEAVQRSALALKTLLYETSGAIAAAATTSLPERVGGDKNYDYRFSWIRDSAFTVDAFLNLGLNEEVQSAVAWMLSALRRSEPDLHVFYTLDGDVPGRASEVDVPGYRHSRPVRHGNTAAKQIQLGSYGDLFDMLGHYVDAGHVLDDRAAHMLAALADQCCQNWQKKDSGIWELPDLQHYTISKIGCWVALDRAGRMAKEGDIPDKGADHWERNAQEIKAWVAENCWSEAKQSYTFYAGTDKLDAAVLLAGRTGFDRGPRLASTIEAVTAELGRGPAVYRYTGMEDEEGAFIACSFWLVSALAHNGQLARAAALMDEAVGMANDLGLLSEQFDPGSGDLLGNIPQGLSHLSLINAAKAVEQPSF
jgi:GH15 family glucan-1,4-alpha-glucosidase